MQRLTIEVLTAPAIEQLSHGVITAQRWRDIKCGRVYIRDDEKKAVQIIERNLNRIRNEILTKGVKK